jgi:subtilase family serine protease
LATIYDLDPLFSAGITGKGQTIAVVEDSDPADLDDWQVFGRNFGLASYTGGRVVLRHPGGSRNCLDPAVRKKSEDEAILDTEWASAAAPDALVILASCKTGS